MNSTQKGAWIMLSGVLLSAVCAAYVGSIFMLGRIPPSPFSRIGPVLAILIPVAAVGLAVLLLAKRQSRVEPESDERDKAIMTNAVLASFFADGLLLLLVILALGLTLVQTGSIPVYVLTLIFLGVLVATTLVYSVAILVQYGRTEKENNHE